MSKKEDEKKLKWRFDVSTFRLIGRELITDRITALFELVKNSYDANAKRVDVIFENLQPITSIDESGKTKIEINPNSKIIIKDDGYGMSFEDIRDKWMVIGTSSKRINNYSPEPFNRRCVGEKGIGRFAVDKLGKKVNIISKNIDDSELLNVEIDWAQYEKKYKESTEDEFFLFTDIENHYTRINSSIGISGTSLEISPLREFWEKKNIERLYKELTKIVSPFYPNVIKLRGFHIASF